MSAVNEDRQRSGEGAAEFIHRMAPHERRSAGISRRSRGTKWRCVECGKKVTMFHGLKPLDIGMRCFHRFERVSEQ